MFEKTRKGRGLASALGLALLAMLAFGALWAGAAQASPVWHVNGQTLAEKGIAEETFSGEGKGAFEIGLKKPGQSFTVSCAETALGKIVGKNELEEKLSLSGCEVVGYSKVCEVKPAAMETGSLTGTSAEVHSTGTFLTIHLSGAFCALSKEWPITGATFHPQYGSDAVKLTVGASGSGQVEGEPVSFSGSSTWQMSGENKGQEFGVGSQAGAPYFSFAYGSKGSGNGQLSLPTGIAIDAGGNRWVTDTGNGRVEKFNAKGEYLSQFGTKGSGNGQLGGPSGIAIDASGNFWVVDSGNNRIEEFNSKGEYVTKFGSKGTGNGQLLIPAGIAIDASGNIWVADTRNNRIEEFNSKGEYLSQFGSKGSGNGQLNEPNGIAIDASGTIWVTDSNNNRVEMFSSSGKYLGQFGTLGSGNGQLSLPTGIAIDAGGNVWVADTHNNRIEEFNSKGEYVAKLGDKGTGDGQFTEPLGIAIGANSEISAVDTGNNRVQVWVKPL